MIFSWYPKRNRLRAMNAVIMYVREERKGNSYFLKKKLFLLQPSPIMMGNNRSILPRIVSFSCLCKRHRPLYDYTEERVITVSHTRETKYKRLSDRTHVETTSRSITYRLFQAVNKK